MSMQSPLRRLAVAFVSLAVAVLIFRGNVASALVTRGDDALRAGDLDGAVRYYSRAMRLDGRSAVAADRLAFYLLMRRRRGDVESAYKISDVALRAIAVASASRGKSAVPSPGASFVAPALLSDRGLAALRLGNLGAAERDFTAAAATTGDPRYAYLAARAAARRGDRAAERAHLRAALRFDASYAPARALLARTAR